MEEIKEMASGTPQPSGMSLPLGTQIESDGDLKIPNIPDTIPKVSGPEKPPIAIKLNPADARKLGKLVQDEEAALAVAKKAAKRRDMFCVDLEKEYNLTGKVWKVDFQKGAILVVGDRETEQS